MITVQQIKMRQLTGELAANLIYFNGMQNLSLGRMTSIGI